MNIPPVRQWPLRARSAISLLAFAAVSCLLSVTVRGQIFITDFTGGKVSEYDLNTGAAVNTSLITGLTHPGSIAVSGNMLYVATDGAISKYTTSGATVNTSFISGAQYWGPIAVEDNYLCAVYSVNGISNWQLGVFDATTGAAINSSILSWLNDRDAFACMSLSGGNIYGIGTDDFWKLTKLSLTGQEIYSFTQPLYGGTGLAVTGNNVYVSHTDASAGSQVMLIDAATGALVNSSFITGLFNPSIQAVLDSNLYIENGLSPTIAQYATDGSLVNAALVTTGNITRFAVSPQSAVIPESSSWPWLAGGLSLMAAALRLRPRSSELKGRAGVLDSS